MAEKEKTGAVGILGLGSMGGNIADRLHSNGYPLVLYDRASDKYAHFKGMDGVTTSNDIKDFSQKLDAGCGGEGAVVW
ncbi:MAG: NAD(P)-binding domain-containing protein, partial [Candidatus Micrarchaeaceae archaeon]